jgi:hypothetical protein
MLLLELPAVLVEDIVLIAACDFDPYNACRLREVNRFFERVATKTIATHWLCRLTNGEERNMLDPFRLRLIQIFIGDHDRGGNALRTHVYAMCDYLAGLSADNVFRSIWLARVGMALNACHFCEANGHGLRQDGPPLPRLKAAQAHRWVASRAGPVLQDLRVSCLIIAILTDDAELQRQMLSEGCDPRDWCLYLGQPLEMACRLGLTEAVECLLDASNDGFVDSTDMEWSLFSAVRSNRPEVVALLFSRYRYNLSDSISVIIAAQEADKNSNREIRELLLANGGSVIPPQIKCAQNRHSGRCKERVG